MSEDIIYADSYDFDSRIEYGIRLVVFYAEWCVQSRGLMSILEEIADEYYDSIRIIAVDVEQSPVVIFFIDGKMVERIGGANPPNVYTDILDEII